MIFRTITAKNWWLQCLVGVVILSVIYLEMAPAQSRTPALPDFSAQRAFEYLQVLAGRIGERAAGTEGEALAVQYISTQFKSWGLQTTLLPVSVPVWYERRARLWVEGEQIFEFPAKAAVFGGRTKADGVVGGFVDIGKGTSADLERKDLKGKIVLVHRDVYIEYPDIWLTDRLVPLGVAGMIFYSSAGRKGIPIVYFNFKRSLKEPTPPAVVISYEDAMRLGNIKPKSAGLVVQADIEWKDSHSVIGELKGSSKADEIVIFSAHDDTSYTSPGAIDDGGGVAAVMELARAFSQGPRPARTLRFIAWGGHELGLMGSEAYLRRHANEIAKAVALINYDLLGSPRGTVSWRTAGGDDWFKFIQGASKSVGLSESGGRNPGGTDATNFSAVEIPSVQIGSGEGRENHTPWDNLDLTTASGLHDGILLGAAIGQRLANDTNLDFPHKFPPEILKQIRDEAARYGWGVRPEANLPPRRQN